MTFTKLNDGWDADPNAPEVTVDEGYEGIIVRFCLNTFLNPEFSESDIGQLTFNNCHKYSFNSMNDEGYYLGQYRHNYTELPWGEYYILDTDWKNDFPKDAVIVGSEWAENLTLIQTQRTYRCFECFMSSPATIQKKFWNAIRRRPAEAMLIAAQGRNVETFWPKRMSSCKKSQLLWKGFAILVVFVSGCTDARGDKEYSDDCRALRREKLNVRNHAESERQLFALIKCGFDSADCEKAFAVAGNLLFHNRSEITIGEIADTLTSLKARHIFD